MTLPVTIIGGYLGAGKTTLVNHMLRNADGLRLAVLVNEFGELPIDEDLIEAKDDAMISIAGGCVCCSYGNDLTLAMLDLAKMEPGPDHVLIEASGVALPGAIAASISLLSGFQIDGTVVLADAETIQQQAKAAYIGDTIERQLNDADLVVLSKADLVDDSHRSETTAWIKQEFGGVEVVPATHGAVPRDVLLQVSATPATGSDKHAHQAGHFSSVSITPAGPLDAESLARRLASADLALARAKGFVEDLADGIVAIQVVGRRWDVVPAPPGAKPSLVAIGLRETFDSEAVKRVLNESARQLETATE